LIPYLLFTTLFDVESPIPTRLTSRSPEETARFGEKLGGLLPSGSVVLLTGPLGSGKTVLAKGIARGMGIEEEIVSPTYTLVAEYQGIRPLDTSTGLLMIAARHGDATASLTLRHGLQHAPTLLPLIDGLFAGLSLAAKDLSLIVCSVGPGSFTGIRIALATAKGMSLGLSIPVVGVSTLDAFALPYAFFEGDVYPVIDARKGKCYTALFRGGNRIGEYLDIPPAVLGGKLIDSGQALLVGPDAEEIFSAVQGERDPDAFCGIHANRFVDPLALLRLGEDQFMRDGADPSGLVPLYLRKSEAEITTGRTI
jgi:tRNA threonylcarbamoyladenosine biosynthesis protein TsaB